MDVYVILALQAAALLVAPFAIPLTLFVSMKFGLVGGTPRELLKVQLDVEHKKVEVESQRVEAMKAETNLRVQRQQLESEIKKAMIEQKQNPPQRPIINPHNGLRG